MNFEPEIELFEENGLLPVYEDVVNRLGVDAPKVSEKLSLYRRITLRDLLRSKKLDKINGTYNPSLYELKIKSLRVPVRFVCSIEGRIILLLNVFFSSGSRGVAEKHLQIAITRLKRWRAVRLHNK